MELFWPLAVIRWVHLGSLLVLFGAALFALYDGPQSGDTRSQVWITWSAVLTGCCWVIMFLADMTDHIRSLLSFETWQVFFFETGFGWVWRWRLAALATPLVCVLFAPASATAGPPLAVAGLSAALLISLGWLGHGEGIERTGSIVSYGCHVLGAGAWLGGLVPLLQRLRYALGGGDPASIQVTLERFSRIGMVAVALIFGSGMVNAYLRSVTLPGLITTDYGRVLAIKLLLFVVLLALAAANRWIFLRRLRENAAAKQPLRLLTLSVTFEQLLGASIIALAVVLGSISPTE